VRATIKRFKDEAAKKPPADRRRSNPAVGLDAKE
jgi:hypothetical protein